MANAWDVTDAQLQRELTAIIAGESGDGDWNCHLYQNDYTPVPGSEELDYVECDFPGYDQQSFSPAHWGSVTVVAHVAQSTNSDVATFIADSSGFSSQPVYGYFLTNDLGDYVWGERFDAVRTIHPDDILRVTLIRRHGVAPS